MWLGSPQQLAKVNVSEVPVVSTSINFAETVRRRQSAVAVTQVAAMCRCGCCQLRQLRSLVRSMSAEAVKTLVQAFISCHLDYCNSLFYGIAESLMT